MVPHDALYVAQPKLSLLTGVGTACELTSGVLYFLLSPEIMCCSLCCACTQALGWQARPTGVGLVHEHRLLSIWGRDGQCCHHLCWCHL